MIYWQLFWTFIGIGFVGFGGGMAIISLIQQEVLQHGWMTETEFVDIVAISQVTPGPIGINCATYVGYTASGTVWGSLLASIAIIIPSLIIMLSICFAYDRISRKWQDNKVFQVVMRIIRILVVCLIAWAAYTMITPATFIDTASWIIFGTVVVLSVLPVWVPQIKNQQSKIVDWVSHPILLIVLAGIVGYIMYI